MLNLLGGLDTSVAVVFHGRAQCGEMPAFASLPLRFQRADTQERLLLTTHHPKRRMSQGLNLLQVAEDRLKSTTRSGSAREAQQRWLARGVKPLPRAIEARGRFFAWLA